jgi:hypothetical protein
MSNDWLKKNPKKAKGFQLKYKYGITIEDYDRMFSNQAGLCAICGVSQSKISKQFAVDHCHDTNKVRGLLCSKCNTAIGQFNHNFDIVINAAKYLEKTS